MLTAWASICSLEVACLLPLWSLSKNPRLRRVWWNRKSFEKKPLGIKCLKAESLFAMKKGRQKSWQSTEAFVWTAWWILVAKAGNCWALCSKHFPSSWYKCNYGEPNHLGDLSKWGLQHGVWLHCSPQWEHISLSPSRAYSYLGWVMAQPGSGQNLWVP